MARANGKRSRRPQGRSGRTGAEEVGPTGQISRPEIVNALFPLALECRRSWREKISKDCCLQPRSPLGDTAIIGLDPALLLAAVVPGRRRSVTWRNQECSVQMA